MTYRFVLWEPLRDVQAVDLGGDLLPVSWLGDPDGRQILRQTEQPLLLGATKPASSQVENCENQGSLPTPHPPQQNTKHPINAWEYFSSHHHLSLSKRGSKVLT